MILHEPLPSDHTYAHRLIRDVEASPLLAEGLATELTYAIDGLTDRALAVPDESEAISLLRLARRGRRLVDAKTVVA